MFCVLLVVGTVQPEGLKPLSVRERAEGRTGNDRGPVEASQRPGLPAQLLQPSAEGNKESARSVERSEKEKGKQCGEREDGEKEKH